MLGQLCMVDRGWGRPRQERLYGLPILRAEMRPAGFLGQLRLRRAGRGLRRGGALRVLAPGDFSHWPLLRELGLRPVDPDPLLRAQGAPLALELLLRRDLDPHRATVALRGIRAGREMARAAAALCPSVRRLVVDAPAGGEELAGWLRREFGVPILPPGERGEVALRFQEGRPAPEEACLDLFGSRPELGGLQLAAPCLAEGDRADLPMLTALWEGGRLGLRDIKIT